MLLKMIAGPVGLSSLGYEGPDVSTLINYHKYASSILMRASRGNPKVDEIDQMIISILQRPFAKSRNGFSKFFECSN